jgi:hypothetical protein
MKPALFHKRICKVCSLVAATLILPALAYAQNNQGNGGINLGVPNGTYIYTISGSYNGAPLAASGRETFLANATGTGGTTSGETSFSLGGTIFSRITTAGTFTVNADGCVTWIDKQTSGSLLLTLHFNVYPTASGTTYTFVQTDTGAVATGTGTR